MTAAKTQAQSNGKPPETLAEALVAIQSDAPTIPLDATNPHFKSKFASLAGVMEKVRPVITKNGVAIVQRPTTLDGAPALTTKLLHVSGESEEDTMLLLPAKADPQGQGSALTYARRYMVLAMLGLVGDEDDDGEAASAPAEQGQRKAEPKPTGDPLPDAQVNELGLAIGKVGIHFDRLCLLFGSVGAEAPTANSSAALRNALSALTPEQAAKLNTAVNAEADRGE